MSHKHLIVLFTTLHDITSDLVQDKSVLIRNLPAKMPALSIDGIKTLHRVDWRHMSGSPLIESFCQDKMSDVSYWTTWLSDYFTI